MSRVEMRGYNVHVGYISTRLGARLSRFCLYLADYIIGLFTG